MSIAALYDIHGNLPALEAVLEDVKSASVDAVVVGGDVVPGPMPGEALERLSALPVPVSFIRGNGESEVIRAGRGQDMPRVPERFHAAMHWVAAALSPGQRAELDSWPLTLELDVAGIGSVLFCHATPRDDNEIFTRRTPEERLRPVFGPTGADLVVCGHTHMQFDRNVAGVQVVNAGSVGMPFGKPGAYWILLGPELEFRRTVYDTEEAVRRISETGYPSLDVFEIRQPPLEATMVEVFESAALS